MNFIKCEKLEKSMAELQFSIDAEAFKAAVADVFKKEGKKYPVQGFRKGKAPKALIEKMYGADVFTYDAINELFPAAYEEAVKAAGIEPVGRPEVSVDSASEAEGATLTVKVAVKPEVKIGAYNGLTVEKTVHTVSDEAVEFSYLPAAVRYELWNPHGPGPGKQLWNRSYGSICSSGKNRFFRLHAGTGFWKCIFHLHCPKLRRRKRKANFSGNQKCGNSCICILPGDQRSGLCICRAAYGHFCKCIPDGDYFHWCRISAN